MDDLEKALPAGATPKDVADDITAKVSEGEFIIPAQVVRFLGVSRLQKMVEKAKKELEQTNPPIEEEGEVITEDDDLGEVEGEENLPAFAEGGLVSSQPQAQTMIEWEWQTTPSGFRIRVPKLSGKYVSSNFSVERKSVGEGYSDAQREKVGLNKDLKDWSVDDFSTYSRSVGTPQGRMGGKVADTLVGAVAGPIKSVIDKVVGKKDEAAKQALDKMSTTGLDQNGNALSPEDMAKVKEAKALVDNPVADGVAEKVAGVVSGSVGNRDLTKTTVKAVDAATGSHLQNTVDKVKGVVDDFKDSVKETLRSGVDTTYGQRKDAAVAEKEKKGLVDKPSNSSSDKDPSKDYGSSDRHDDGTPNVTGNQDYDREIEDSINQ